MSEEEKEIVEGIKEYPTHRELILIHIIDRLQEENEKYIIKMTDEQYKKVIKLAEEGINIKWKDKIRKLIKEELPDDEIMETCNIYDVNGIVIEEKLKELLEGEKNNGVT